MILEHEQQEQQELDPRNATIEREEREGERRERLAKN